MKSALGKTGFTAIEIHLYLCFPENIHNTYMYGVLHTYIGYITADKQISIYNVYEWGGGLDVFCLSCGRTKKSIYRGIMPI